MECCAQLGKLLKPIVTVFSEIIAFPDETLNSAFPICYPLYGTVCLISHVPHLKYLVVGIFNL